MTDKIIPKEDIIQALEETRNVLIEHGYNPFGITIIENQIELLFKKLEENGIDVSV